MGDRAHDADRDPWDHCVADATEELAQRDAGESQLSVEHGHLEGCLGHTVTLDATKDLPDVVGFHLPRAKKARPEIATDREPRRIDILGRVEGIGACNALTPTLTLVGLDSDDERFPDVLGAESCAKGRYQGQANSA